MCACQSCTQKQAAREGVLQVAFLALGLGEVAVFVALAVGVLLVFGAGSAIARPVIAAGLGVLVSVPVSVEVLDTVGYVQLLCHGASLSLSLPALTCMLASGLMSLRGLGGELKLARWPGAGLPALWSWESAIRPGPSALALVLPVLVFSPMGDSVVNPSTAYTYVVWITFHQ